jgi:hypothetical protein
MVLVTPQGRFTGGQVVQYQRTSKKIDALLFFMDAKFPYK